MQYKIIPVFKHVEVAGKKNLTSLIDYCNYCKTAKSEIWLFLPWKPMFDSQYSLI